MGHSPFCFLYRRSLSCPPIFGVFLNHLLLTLRERLSLISQPHHALFRTDTVLDSIKGKGYDKMKNFGRFSPLAAVGVYVCCGIAHDRRPPAANGNSCHSCVDYFRDQLCRSQNIQKVEAPALQYSHVQSSLSFAPMPTLPSYIVSTRLRVSFTILGVWSCASKT